MSRFFQWMEIRFTCAMSNMPVSFTLQTINILFCLSFCSPVSVLDTDVPMATTSALEEMALYSNKRKLRQGRRSLEAPVPT